jgi:hypothetical protein
MEPDEQMEEAKDEGAIGRVVLMIVKHPKAVVSFLAAIVAGLSGFTVWRESSRPAPIPTIEARAFVGMDKKLTQVLDKVVKMDLKTDAILEAMPEEQKKRALRRLDLQLAAIRAAADAQQQP